MIQSAADLDQWYQQDDPWNYQNSLDDQKRKDILLSELPDRKYQRVLDIGCGNGFITNQLPGKKIIGVDFSPKAIKIAQKNNKQKHINYQTADLFDLSDIFKTQKFDLIIITGVLYPQYIDQAYNLVYLIIDNLLKKKGILACVHISDWYQAFFPYLKLKEFFYPYLQFTHHLEIYIK